MARQAHAGLLWSRQFYHYVIHDWLHGDPGQPPPPPERKRLRNSDWTHMYNRDVISTPDKWEYPAYFAWDTAFHLIAQARIDPDFAKEQILLLSREWYMHPNGTVPACEYNFSDVNPPVLTWAAWRIYKIAAARGGRDRAFLARFFHKHLLNFNWWVNRKDVTGRHIFSGGFLGLDNIGVFDRSRPLPDGVFLEQADGTAWMAMYCTTMLAIALELSREDPAYEDIASKFFEHFMAIADALNTLDGDGLWDEQDGFYYDRLRAAIDRFPCGCALWWASCRCWPWRSSTTRYWPRCRRLPSACVGFSRTATICSPRSRKWIQTSETASCAACSPCPAGRGSNPRCGTCSTRRNSFLPGASARCRNGMMLSRTCSGRMAG